MKNKQKNNKTLENSNWDCSTRLAETWEKYKILPVQDTGNPSLNELKATAITLWKTKYTNNWWHAYQIDEKANTTEAIVQVYIKYKFAYKLLKNESKQMVVNNAAKWFDNSTSSKYFLDV